RGPGPPLPHPPRPQRQAAPGGLAVRLAKENTMLDDAIKTQLKAYLERLRHPIELVASLDDGDKSREMGQLLTEIAALSPLVTVREDGTAQRRPSFAIGVPGERARVHFAGIPLGHEFSSLVLALLQVGGHPPKVDDAVLHQI